MSMSVVWADILSHKDCVWDRCILSLLLSIYLTQEHCIKCPCLSFINRIKTFLIEFSKRIFISVNAGIKRENWVEIYAYIKEKKQHMPSKVSRSRLRLEELILSSMPCTQIDRYICDWVALAPQDERMRGWGGRHGGRQAMCQGSPHSQRHSN